MLFGTLKERTENLFEKAEIATTKMVVNAGGNLFDLIDDEDQLISIKEMLDLYQESKKLMFDQIEMFENMKNEVSEMKDQIETLQRTNDLLKDQVIENNRLLIRLDEKLDKLEKREA